MVGLVGFRVRVQKFWVACMELQSPAVGEALAELQKYQTQVSRV